MSEILEIKTLIETQGRAWEEYKRTNDELIKAKADGKVAEVKDDAIAEFKTRNGRPVYDGRGILPDVEVMDPELAKVVGGLYGKDLFFDFATKYRLANPEIAPAESICSAPTTITGSASVVDAPWMCEPTTTTVSRLVASSVDADCGTGSAGGVVSCAAAAWITANKARVRLLRNGAARRLKLCIVQSLL